MIRQPSEVVFRLRQEAQNIFLWLAPPRRTSVEPLGPFPGLPLPRTVASRLHASPQAQFLHRTADDILARGLPLFGHLTVPAAEGFGWNEDRIHGRSCEKRFFRRIPYLDAERCGDHKIIWEPNRHQHLVTLAQSWVLDPRPELLAAIEFQLVDWRKENPFHASINWTSALEVAMRALSWIWLAHLVGPAFSPAVQHLLTEGLYQHGRHLAANLSVYFSPNTHLLGEAVALHAIGQFFPAFPESAEWRRRGAAIVDTQIGRQVHPDGGYFEHSDYYHIYALDLFLFHAIVAGDKGAGYCRQLAGMARYLEAIQGTIGAIPGFGDDDGGRFFSPHGERRQFGRATVVSAAMFLREPVPGFLDSWAEQAAWWLDVDCPSLCAPKPCPALQVFRDTGTAVLTDGDVQLIADVGTFGSASGGHSHADALSFVLRQGNEEILIDPGTYTYVGDPSWRDRFRGTPAHNTVSIDGIDQAIAQGPFRWMGRPSVEIIDAREAEGEIRLAAVCEYRGFTHRREWVWLTDLRVLLVDDQIAGETGEHRLEQNWHWGEARFRRYLVLPADAGVGVEQRDGWRSRAFAQKETAPVTCVFRTASLPARLLTGLSLTPTPLRIERTGPDVIIDMERQSRLVRLSH